MTNNQTTNQTKLSDVLLTITDARAALVSAIDAQVPGVSCYDYPKDYVEEQVFVGDADAPLPCVLKRRYDAFVPESENSSLSDRFVVTSGFVMTYDSCEKKMSFSTSLSPESQLADVRAFLSEQTGFSGKYRPSFLLPAFSVGATEGDQFVLEISGDDVRYIYSANAIELVLARTAHTVFVLDLSQSQFIVIDEDASESSRNKWCSYFLMRDMELLMWLPEFLTLAYVPPGLAFVGASDTEFPGGDSVYRVYVKQIIAAPTDECRAKIARNHGGAPMIISNLFHYGACFLYLFKTKAWNTVHCVLSEGGEFPLKLRKKHMPKLQLIPESSFSKRVAYTMIGKTLHIARSDYNFQYHGVHYAQCASYDLFRVICDMLENGKPFKFCGALSAPGGPKRLSAI